MCGSGAAMVGRGAAPEQGGPRCVKVRLGTGPAGHCESTAKVSHGTAGELPRPARYCQGAGGYCNETGEYGPCCPVPPRVLPRCCQGTAGYCQGRAVYCQGSNGRALPRPRHGTATYFQSTAMVVAKVLCQGPAGSFLGTATVLPGSSGVQQGPATWYCQGSARVLGVAAGVQCMGYCLVLPGADRALPGFCSVLPRSWMSWKVLRVTAKVPTKERPLCSGCRRCPAPRMPGSRGAPPRYSQGPCWEGGKTRPRCCCVLQCSAGKHEGTARPARVQGTGYWTGPAGSSHGIAGYCQCPARYCRGPARYAGYYKGLPRPCQGNSGYCPGPTRYCQSTAGHCHSPAMGTAEVLPRHCQGTAEHF